MSNEDDFPEGLDSGDEPVATTQERVARARKGWERNRAVYEATEEQFETVQPYIARRYYARYKAYLDAGFSIEQAMELVKEIGIEDDE